MPKKQPQTSLLDRIGFAIIGFIWGAATFVYMRMLIDIVFPGLNIKLDTWIQYLYRKSAFKPLNDKLQSLIYDPEELDIRNHPEIEELRDYEVKSYWITIRTFIKKIGKMIIPLLYDHAFDAFGLWISCAIMVSTNIVGIVIGFAISTWIIGYNVNKYRDTIIKYMKDTAVYELVVTLFTKMHFISDSVIYIINRIKTTWSKIKPKKLGFEAMVVIVAAAALFFWFARSKLGRPKKKVVKRKLAVVNHSLVDYNGRKPGKLSPFANSYVNLGLGLLSLVTVGHFEIYQRFRALLQFASFIPGLFGRDEDLEKCINYGDKDSPCVGSASKKGNALCSTCSISIGTQIVEDHLAKFSIESIIADPIAYSQELVTAICLKKQKGEDHKDIPWFNTLVPSVKRAVLSGLKMTLEDFEQNNVDFRYDSERKQWFVDGASAHHYMEEHIAHRQRRGLGLQKTAKWIPTKGTNVAGFVPSKTGLVPDNTTGTYIEVVNPSPSDSGNSEVSWKSAMRYHTDSEADSPSFASVREYDSPVPSSAREFNERHERALIDTSRRLSMDSHDNSRVQTPTELREQIRKQITDEAGLRFPMSHTPSCPSRSLSPDSQELLINHECVPEPKPEPLPYEGNRIYVIMPQRCKQAADMFDGWLETIKLQFPNITPYTNYIIVVAAVSLIAYGYYYSGRTKNDEKEVDNTGDLVPNEKEMLRDRIRVLQKRLDAQESKNNESYVDAQGFCVKHRNKINAYAECEDCYPQLSLNESAIDPPYIGPNNEEDIRDQVRNEGMWEYIEQWLKPKEEDIPQPLTEIESKLLAICTHDKDCAGYGMSNCNTSCKCKNRLHVGVCKYKKYTEPKLTFPVVQSIDESNISTHHSNKCIHKIRSKCKFGNCVMEHEDDEEIKVNHEAKGTLTKHRARAAGQKQRAPYQKEDQATKAWANQKKEKVVTNDNDTTVRAKKIHFIGYGTDALLKALNDKKINEVEVYTGSKKVGEVSNLGELKQARAMYGNNIQLVPMPKDRNQMSDFSAEVPLQYKPLLKRVAEGQSINTEERNRIVNAINKGIIENITGNLRKVISEYKQDPLNKTQHWYHPDSRFFKYNSTYAWEPAYDSEQDESRLYSTKVTSILKRNDFQVPIDSYREEILELDNVPNQIIHVAVCDKPGVNVVRHKELYQSPRISDESAISTKDFGDKMSDSIEIINESRITGEPYQEHLPHIQGIFQLKVNINGISQHQGIIFNTGQGFNTVWHNFIDKRSKEVMTKLMDFTVEHPLYKIKTTISNVDNFNKKLDLCKPLVDDQAKFIGQLLDSDDEDKSKRFKPYTFSMPKIGEHVWMYSFDKNGNIKISQGLVHSEPVNGWFRTTCQSEPGDSGAPYFNKYGAIVGIHKGTIQEGMYNCMIGCNLGIMAAMRDNMSNSLLHLNFSNGRPL